MFDPIAASQEIRDSYIDYITTTFHMADDTYQKQLHSALREEGAVARGPFLDIGGSFETGKTLRELMEEGVISSLFDRLEPIPEAERELKLDRPLVPSPGRGVAQGFSRNEFGDHYGHRFR